MRRGAAGGGVTMGGVLRGVPLALLWALRVLWAVHEVCAAKFEMHGACAAVVTLQKWQEAPVDGGEPVGKWDMRVKVHPWTLFGKVHVRLRGNGLVTENVFGASADGPLGPSELTLVLSPDPVGGEDQFELSGSGLLVGDPALSCSDLATEEQLAHGECELGAHLQIKGFEPATDIAPGHFSFLVHLETWVEPSKVSFNFRNGDTARVTDFWNAELVAGGAEGDTHVSFKIKKNVLAWVGERKSSFGFSFVGSLTAMPGIVCSDFGKPFPRPPPPSPPGLPPVSPPHYETDATLCFLGGEATWLHAPDPDPQIGWALPWQVAVSLPRWEPGVTVVIAFEGEKLYEHPVRLSRIEPDDGGTRVETVTAHSLGIALLPSPLNAFTITGTGAVTGIRSMSCCCQAPPPPPPPPPQYQLSAMDAWLASHAASPPPKPPPPPRPPRIDRTIDGLAITSPAPPPFPPPPPKGDVSTWTRVFAMLVGFAVLMFSGLRWLERRSEAHLKKINQEKTVKKIALTRAIAPATEEPTPGAAKKSIVHVVREEGPCPEKAAAKALLMQMQGAGSSSDEETLGTRAARTASKGTKPTAARKNAASSGSSSSDSDSSSRSSDSASGRGRALSGSDSDNGEGSLDNGVSAESSRCAKIVVQTEASGSSPKSFSFDSRLIDSAEELMELVADGLGRELSEVRLELVDKTGRVKPVKSSTKVSALHAACMIRLAQAPSKTATRAERAKNLLRAPLRRRGEGKKSRSGHVALREEESDDDIEDVAALRPAVTISNHCVIDVDDEVDSLLAPASLSSGTHGKRRGRGVKAKVCKQGADQVGDVEDMTGLD